MADASVWIEMAKESLESGKVLQRHGLRRSAASRFYFAAYQATTALLIHDGQTPPSDREGWAHEDTPRMLGDHLKRYAKPGSVTWLEVSNRLRQLRDTRVDADYYSSKPVSEASMVEIERWSGHLVKNAAILVGIE